MIRITLIPEAFVGALRYIPVGNSFSLSNETRHRSARSEQIVVEILLQ